MSQPTMFRGSPIGILGGGQLGMMLAEAATALDIPTLVWTPNQDDPALNVTSDALVGPFENSRLERIFTHHVRGVVLEFENVPIELVEAIERKRKPVYPGSRILRIAADRILEKRALQNLGIYPAPWRPIESLKDTKPENFDEFPFPAILKTARGGYDGKGQVLIENASDIKPAFLALGVPCVLEQKLSLAYEVSVIIARDQHGATAAYPAIENRHKDGILFTSRWPGRNICDRVEAIVQDAAWRIAMGLGLVGLMTIEFFVVGGESRGYRVYVNEIAPRTHNSGHGTIEACATSQFEQHIRIAAGMPLGSPEPNRGWLMRNLIGVSKDDAETSTRRGGLLHWYGKPDVRPGRKMGHITYPAAEPATPR